MNRTFLILAELSLWFSTASLAPRVLDEANAYDTVFQEDFEDGQAQGWNLEPGWQVQPDGGNQVLSGEGHAWARAGQSFDGDLRQALRVKLLRGRIHLVVRLTDDARYFIGFDGEGSDLNKQYFPDKFQERLAVSSQPHSLDRWYQVEIVLQGDTIVFLVDGSQQWAYTDPQPLASGAIAFETLDGSQAYVDDLAVDQPAQPFVAPAPVPAATAVESISPTQSSQAVKLTWVRTGGPLGGLGYDIRMRQDNPDRMLVTDAFAGVFSSSDGGETWTPSSDGITTRVGNSGDAIPVFSLTIDPNNPDIVWAGTQFQRGIFKSVDGGKTWKKMDRGVLENEGITFRGFTVMPADSNIVYAAAELSSWAWTPDHRERSGVYFDLTRGVVYKTTNGGQSWDAVWRGDDLARYIWIDPHDTDTLYVSTGIFDREAANSDLAAGIPGGEGIIKSTDGGLNWTHINNGLRNLYVGSLFMHPTNPEILLAGAGNNSYYPGSGVYLSVDGGNSWTQTLEARDAITAVEISSSHSNIAYAGGRSAVYRSEDGGETWLKTTGSGDFWGAPGVQTGFPIDFQVDPRNPDRLLANAYGGGAFLSEDGGHSWRDVSQGYTGAQVRDLAVDPTAAARVVAVARSGIFATYDGGATWDGINPSTFDSIEWNLISIDPSDSQHLVGGLNVHGRLVESKDGGRNWEMVGGPYEDQMGWRAFAFAPSDPTVAYAGTSAFVTASVFAAARPGLGTFVSHDNAGSWVPADGGPMQDANVSSLAVGPSDPEFVLAATTNRGLLKSEDGGENWIQVGGGLPASKPVLSVAIMPTDPNVVLAGLERGGIFRSTDGGNTWSRNSGGLAPEASVSDILFDPTDPAMVLYLADLNSGVYRSEDGGNSWIGINEGLLVRTVNALALSDDGLHLYAASEGSGVYRLDLNGQPPEPATAPPPAATATKYSYAGAATTAPDAPADEGARGLPSCGGAALPLGLAVIALSRTKPRARARSESRGAALRRR